MERRRFCGVVLPLEEIALRSATCYLWVESILRERYRYEYFWQETEMETVVRNKLLQIVLPETLKKRMRSLVNPIQCDISDWTFYHFRKFDDRNGEFDQGAVRHLRLTWSGSIDYRSTAVELIESKRFDVWTRFKIACLYCLEDKIRLLWEELPAKYHTRCTNEAQIWLRVKMSHYWCYVLREKGTNLEQLLEKESVSPLDFHRHAFKTSAVQGNKAAVQFFWQKLPNSQTDILVMTFNSVMAKKSRLACSSGQPFDSMYADVICYLLSIMSPEQQMQVFSEHPIHVLTTFLNWRCHHLLSYVAGLCWSFFPRSKCSELLSTLHKTIEGLRYYFPNMLQEFLIHSPDYFRKAFLCHGRVCDFFLPKFFLNQDAETVRAMFRNVEAFYKTRFVFSEKFFKLMNDNFLSGRWNMVKVCLREASLSKEDRERHRSSFMKYLNRTGADKCHERRLHQKRFLEFLDQSDADTEKSVAREETHPQAKKLCIRAEL